MFDKELFEYISIKYNVETKKEISSFTRIESMIQLDEELKKIDKLIFKGALNLLKNYGYRRDGKLTVDMDYSIRDKSIASIAKELKIFIPKIKNKIFSYSYTGSEKLTIASNGYNGLRLDFHARNVGGNFEIAFHIDIAIEELIEGYTTFYSIERSLADKYVTMIQKGSWNTRRKDFIDLSSLYPNCNKDVLHDLIRKLINARSVKKNKIKWFKDNCGSIAHIKELDMSETIIKINENVL